MTDEGGSTLRLEILLLVTALTSTRAPNAAIDVRTAEKLTRIHYGNPCARKVRNYLISDVGKPCVPLLNAAELTKLAEVYDRLPMRTRPYFRFAFIVSYAFDFYGREVPIRKLVFLDATPSTFPDGFVPNDSLTTGVVQTAFRVLGVANEVYRASDNSVFAEP